MVNLRLVNLRIASAGDGRTMGGIHAASLLPSVAKFRFTNVGTTPVKITDLQPSCGCTTAFLEKRQYGPGESGEIEARFKFNGRLESPTEMDCGQNRLGSASTDNTAVGVSIPEAISISPEFVLWRIGDQLKSKTVRILVPDGVATKVLSVQADNSTVKLELSEIRPGKELEVKITPISTNQPGSATLSIRTDYPPDSPATYYAYVRVK